MSLEYYYTAKEARHVLGDIHPNTLSQYVESGKLKKYIPPGKKNGLYLKTEVHALADEIQQFYNRGASDDRKERENERQRSLINSS